MFLSKKEMDENNEIIAIPLPNACCVLQTMLTISRMLLILILKVI